MLLKIHQYISITIVVFVILAALWPLLAHAVIQDGVDFYNSPTNLVALVAPTGAPEAPKLVPDRTLERIAWCESQNRPDAKNPHSSASGLFQFLNSSWESYGKELWGSTEGKSVFSKKDSTELAYYVASRYGYGSWSSSFACWSN